MVFVLNVIRQIKRQMKAVPIIAVRNNRQWQEFVWLLILCICCVWNGRRIIQEIQYTHSTYTETHNICTDTKTHIVYHIDTPPHTDTCTDTTQAHAHHTHCIHLCKSQCVQSCKCSDEIPQTRVCAEEPGQSPYCLPFVFRQIYDLKLRSWHSHSTEIAIIIYWQFTELGTLYTTLFNSRNSELSSLPF